MLRAALVVALTSGVAFAQQDRPPVDVQVNGIFGDELLVPMTHATVLITLTNRSRERFQGELYVRVDDWRHAPERHRVRIDLPPNATRRTQLPVYVRESGAQVKATYIDGRELGAGMIAVGYNAGADGIVVLSDPPRLRSALLDIEAEQNDPYGGTRRVGLPIGVVSMDPDTGDPMAPTRAVGWGGVKLLVASAPDLERLTPPQQAALRDWLRVGGEVLVFPRTPEDVRGPFLRSITGPLEWIEDYAAVGHYATVPPDAQGKGFSAPPGSMVRPEPFGMSFPVGFGRLFLASYDGASPPFVERPETRRTVVSVVHRFRQPGQDRPVFSFGGRDDSSEQWGVGSWDFRPLRTVLDPNESFRPALGLVAIVLLLYVFVVGPLNFSFVGKKNRPILAMVTTPVAAAGCLFVLLMVGYIGKGTTMRYRAVSLLELQETDGDGPQRRYMGLFLTRPATFDMESVDRGVTRLMYEGGARMPLAEHDGDAVELIGLQGGLWETLFVREEEVVSLGGGGIVFERNGGNLTAVRNESETPIQGAFILDASGGVYPVGDIPAGGTGAVAGSPSMSIGVENPSFWGENDAEVRNLAATMGLDREDAPAVFGLVQTMGGTMVTGMPTLWAIVPSEPAMEAEVFIQETDLRFVRVTPRIDGAPVPVRWDGPDTPGREPFE